MPPTMPLPIAAAKVRANQARSTMATSPDPGRRGAARVFGKAPRRTAKRALDTIAKRGVAAVEHGREYQPAAGLAGAAENEVLAGVRGRICHGPLLLIT